MGNSIQLPAHVTSQDLALVWDRYDKHKRGELSYNKAHKFLKELAHVAGLKYDKSEADRLLKSVDCSSSTAASSAVAATVDPNEPLKKETSSSEAVPRIDFEKFRRLFLVVLEKEREQQDQQTKTKHNRTKTHVRRQLSSSLKEVQTRMHQQEGQQQREVQTEVVAAVVEVSTTVAMPPTKQNAKKKKDKKGGETKRWQTIGEEEDDDDEEKEEEGEEGGDDEKGGDKVGGEDSERQNPTANRHERNAGIDNKTAQRGKAATLGASVAEAFKEERRRRDAVVLGAQRRSSEAEPSSTGILEKPSQDASRYRTWDHLSTVVRTERSATEEKEGAGSGLATVSTVVVRKRRAAKTSEVEREGEERSEKESSEAAEKKEKEGKSKGAGEGGGVPGLGLNLSKVRSETQSQSEAETTMAMTTKQGDDEVREEMTEAEIRRQQSKSEPPSPRRADAPVVRRRTTSFIHSARSKLSSLSQPTETGRNQEDLGEEDTLVSAALVVIYLASPLYHRRFVLWAAGLAVLVAWLLLARLIRRLYLRRALQQKSADEVHHRRRLASESSAVDTGSCSSDLSAFQRVLVAFHGKVVGRLVSPRVGVFAFGAVCFGLAAHGSAHDASLTALFGLTLPSVVLGCCRWKHAVPLADPFNLLSFADGAVVFGIITGSLIAVSGVVGYLVICTSLAISVPLATWHTRRWLQGLKPTNVSIIRDFLMAVVIYPLVGATVFVACMAVSFFVSGLLLSLIFGQIFIGDWSVTLRTVFQFILLTGLVMAIMIGKWPHALIRGGGSLSGGLSRPLVMTISVLCLLCTAMTALTIARSSNH